MSKIPLEFEETTNFNIIKEFMFRDNLGTKYRELFLIYIQRKSHNNTKHRWLCINAKTNKFDPYYNDAKKQQIRWDEHVAIVQVRKDVEDYLRETGSV